MSLKKYMERIRLSGKPKCIKLRDKVDFFELFQKIESISKNCFILESLGEDGDKSRYSIIGFNPGKIITEGKDDMTYSKLEQLMPNNTNSREYMGGLVGYLGFDLFTVFEKSVKMKRHPRFSRFQFGVYTDGIILDKKSGNISYFHYSENRYELVKDFIRLKSYKVKSLQSVKAKKLGYSMTGQEHAEVVEKVKKQIFAGNIFQCVIGFKSEYEISGDTIEIYRNLRKTNPSPHMYYLKFGKQKIIGASPELLFRMRKGKMETYPLAGTIKRGRDEREDEIFANILRSDPKELAEHKMLVDLHRNDIGRVAKFGTVKVNNLLDIKKFSHVQHLSSEVSGVIDKNNDMFSALASNFPAGTLAGAPKIEAIKILQNLEKLPRGPYGGAVGHFGFNGNCTFAIPIRTLFITGNYAFTQAGSGIVADSIPKNEYIEVRQKLKAIEEALK